mgnify:CR=1 FL=1
MLPANLIYQLVYGSHAYGTTTEGSDLDIRGIFVPSIWDVLSMQGVEDVRGSSKSLFEGIETEWIYYPVTKFVKLAMKCNPSVLEWLFVRKEYQIQVEWPGQILIEHRNHLLSKQIYHRLKGYAMSEFHSLTKLTGKTGEKRKKEILKYGYSPKNAMNCIRLLQQGVEMLKYGTLTLPRPNAEDLVEIKEGKWNYSRIIRVFSDLLEEIDEAHEKSELPEKTDFKLWDGIQSNIIVNWSKEQDLL